MCLLKYTLYMLQMKLDPIWTGFEVQHKAV